jgi:hypothetical protein
VRLCMIHLVERDGGTIPSELGTSAEPKVTCARRPATPPGRPVTNIALPPLENPSRVGPIPRRPTVDYGPGRRCAGPGSRSCPCTGGRELKRTRASGLNKNPPLSGDRAGGDGMIGPTERRIGHWTMTASRSPTTSSCGRGVRRLGCHPRITPRASFRPALNPWCGVG